MREDSAIIYFCGVTHAFLKWVVVVVVVVVVFVVVYAIGKITDNLRTAQPENDKKIKNNRAGLKQGRSP